MNYVVAVLFAGAAAVVAFNLSSSINRTTSSGPPDPDDKPSPSTNPGPDIKMTTEENDPAPKPPDMMEVVGGVVDELHKDILMYAVPGVGELNMAGEAINWTSTKLRKATHLPATKFSKAADTWATKASDDIEKTMGGVRNALHSATDTIGLHDTVVQKAVDGYYHGVTEAVAGTGAVAVTAGANVVGMAADIDTAAVKAVKPATDAIAAAGADIGEAAASGMEMISTSASKAASTAANAVTHPVATITALEHAVVHKANHAAAAVTTPIQTVAHTVEKAPVVQAVSHAANDAAKAARAVACKLPFIPC